MGVPMVRERAGRGSLGVPMVPGTRGTRVLGVLRCRVRAGSGHPWVRYIWLHCRAFQCLLFSMRAVPSRFDMAGSRCSPSLVRPGSPDRLSSPFAFTRVALPVSRFTFYSLPCSSCRQPGCLGIILGRSFPRSRAGGLSHRRRVPAMGGRDRWARVERAVSERDFDDLWRRAGGRSGGRVGWDESVRLGAGSQWIVAARPLCHLQCPVAYLSRLQRILPAARWELRSTAGSRGRCAAGASPATRALGGRLAPTAGRGAGRRARAPLH